MRGTSPSRHARTCSTAVRLRCGGSGRGLRPARICPPIVTSALRRGPGPQAPSSPGFPRMGVRDEPGPRLKAGVTMGRGDSLAHRRAAVSLAVMPGLVPGIHVLRHRGARRQRARRRRDVDARNKSTAVRLRWGEPGARRWYRRVSGPSTGSGHGLRRAGAAGFIAPCPRVISTGARSAERRNLFARAFRRRNGQISPLRRPFGPAPVEMTRGWRPPEVLTGQQWNKSGHDDIGGGGGAVLSPHFTGSVAA